MAISFDAVAPSTAVTGEELDISPSGDWRDLGARRWGGFGLVLGLNADGFELCLLPELPVVILKNGAKPPPPSIRDWWSCCGGCRNA